MEKGEKPLMMLNPSHVRGSAMGCISANGTGSLVFIAPRSGTSFELCSALNTNNSPVFELIPDSCGCAPAKNHHMAYEILIHTLLNLFKIPFLILRV